MLYSCPNHELSREIIMQNFYAPTMLDTSCTGSFMKRDIDFKWNLLERLNATLKIESLMKVRSQV